MYVKNHRPIIICNNLVVSLFGLEPQSHYYTTYDLIFIYLTAFSLILVKTNKHALYNFPCSYTCHRSVDGESL